MTPRTPRSTRTDTLLPDTTRMRAGDIANEFAGIFHEFGSQVTIVNRSDKILRGYDEQIRDRLLQISMTKGIVFRFNAPFEKVVKNDDGRSEEHTSELQSLMRISYAVFCLKKKKYETQTSYKNNPLHNYKTHQYHQKTHHPI